MSGGRLGPGLGLCGGGVFALCWEDEARILVLGEEKRRA